jgi:hypothetical protein
MKQTVIDGFKIFHRKFTIIKDDWLTFVLECGFSRKKLTFEFSIYFQDSEAQLMDGRGHCSHGGAGFIGIHGSVACHERKMSAATYP